MSALYSSPTRSLFMRGLDFPEFGELIQQTMQFCDSTIVCLRLALGLSDFILLQALKNPSTDATTNFSS